MSISDETRSQLYDLLWEIRTEFHESIVNEPQASPDAIETVRRGMALGASALEVATSALYRHFAEVESVCRDPDDGTVIRSKNVSPRIIGPQKRTAMDFITRIDDLLHQIRH